jgi:hypothetical protein
MLDLGNQRVELLLDFVEGPAELLVRTAATLATKFYQIDAPTAPLC